LIFYRYKSYLLKTNLPIVIGYLLSGKNLIKKLKIYGFVFV
jgi:hypothetical protein